MSPVLKMGKGPCTLGHWGGMGVRTVELKPGGQAGVNRKGSGHPHALMREQEVRRCPG